MLLWSDVRIKELIYINTLKWDVEICKHSLYAMYYCWYYTKRKPEMQVYGARLIGKSTFTEENPQ
jgi:hypothetical protein